MNMKYPSMLCIALAALAAGAAPKPLPEPTPEKLPVWRGFNLLEMFNVGNRGPFREEDFAMIAGFGFNFVRLPMDYRCWIKDKDWKKIDEEALKNVDQAVEYGRKHGIHVCLNFHRAPGYTVAKPPEPKSIWSDSEALDVCAMHWAHFARRYRGIPNANVSFDLMNEPSDIKPEEYAKVAGALVAAIRREDPARLVIADGRSWGTKPATELAGLKIAQMTRGYAPFQLTHYKASWVNSESFPVPSWPMINAWGPLFGPGKKERCKPLAIEGDFPAGTLRLHIGDVSSKNKFVVTGDGAKLWERTFSPGPDDPDCRKVDPKKSWPYGTYDRDYTIPLRAGLRKIELQITDGDWISIREIGISAPGKAERTIAVVDDWGRSTAPVRFAGLEAAQPFACDARADASTLWREMIEPWQAFEKTGVGVMVGEWGAYNRTPHDVTLRWMEDCLQNWRKAGWGWAVWNFRGPFGPLDSGRTDVNYEDFRGHKLDRAMIELLQEY